MKRIFFVTLALVFGVLGLFCSCSSSLGYSVVLWNNTEIPVQEGTVVKVYIKSNISHMYVIGVPETNKKAEIPLWQLTEPLSKRKAEKTALHYSEYAHTYASVKLDGLPIRMEPVNTSRQVYRLRQNEIIRILYKGKGQAPTNGKGNLTGEWLRVLTNGGTQGWCFSYNLDLFERMGDSFDMSSSSDSNSDSVDERIMQIMAKKWYPENFADMIKTGHLNLDVMSAEYGFSFGNQDEEIHSARIKKVGVNKYWDYSTIKKTDDDTYAFDDLQLTLTVRNANTIVVQYIDTDGKTKSETFVNIESDVQEIIENEFERRQEELKRIASAGPVLQSESYGTITFNNENSITWTNYKALVPSVVSSDALGSVTVTLDLFIANSLKSSYDGVLTMHFMGMEKGINFLYKLTDTGLRLEDASRAPIKEGVVTARSSSPLILFFKRK